MSRGSEITSFLDGLTRLSRQQWTLRALVLVSPFVALFATHQAGAPWRSWLAALLLGVTLLSALLPDSHAPLAVLLLTGVHWVLAVGENLSGWLLVVAISLLGFHVACLLAAYGPPSVVLDPVLLRRWSARAGLAAAAGILVWLAAWVAEGLEPPGSGWLLAAALLVLLGWTVLLARRLVGAAG
ncbi:MAG TPA: hypothetical protein VFQ19_01605 [Nocardioidaceae bacterium]|nr:hypothetical protein [Nocardioidaceae bacterium]